jgi:hypothetical protein
MDHHALASRGYPGWRADTGGTSCEVIKLESLDVIFIVVAIGAFGEKVPRRRATLSVTERVGR